MTPQTDNLSAPDAGPSPSVQTGIEERPELQCADAGPNSPRSPIPSVLRWKKRHVVEAIQWTGRNTFDVVTFIEGAPPDIKHPMAAEAWDAYCEAAERDGLRIRTLEDGLNGEAKHIASPGDWIIKGIQGECWPCKPDIFAATYEPADQSADRQVSDAALSAPEEQNPLLARIEALEGALREVSNRVGKQPIAISGPIIFYIQRVLGALSPPPGGDHGK